jgi:NAD(P)-dependent dehydrogenase (short-subunit alcohol dehydrogenase family)
MDSELDFGGKTILVTGSGRNIGRAIVLGFAGRGANVIVNARSRRQEAESVAAEAAALGAKSLVAMGDVSDPATIAEIRQSAERAFGRVDIYVSNAARRLHKDFFDTTHEDWHAHLNMQLTASWYLAKEFAPAMREVGWGRIIHVNGPDGWYGGPMRIPHSTAKGGLHALTRSLAGALGRYGITVNDVVPGFTDTVRDLVTHPHHTAEHKVKGIADTPIRRQPTPAEVAWVCLFLASPRSAAVTGSAIAVDGGKYMRP